MNYYLVIKLNDPAERGEQVSRMMDALQPMVDEIGGDGSTAMAWTEPYLEERVAETLADIWVRDDGGAPWDSLSDTTREMLLSDARLVIRDITQPSTLEHDDQEGNDG